MTLDELIAALHDIKGARNLNGDTVITGESEVVIWNQDGDAAPVTTVDFDRFANDEPYVVVIESEVEDEGDG